MKTYKCDACGTMIDNPYKMKMKEFYVGCSFDCGTVFPIDTKRVEKIDLCHECFTNLRCIFDNKKIAERSK